MADLQSAPVGETSLSFVGVPHAAWPAGASRVSAMYVDPVTAEQFGLVSSQLTLSIGTPLSWDAFVHRANLSTAQPSFSGFDGPALRPGGAAELDDLVFAIESDHLPLAGAAMGHVDVHVVVEVPGSF